MITERLLAMAEQVIKGHKLLEDTNWCRECQQLFPCHAWTLAYEILHPLNADPREPSVVADVSS